MNTEPNGIKIEHNQPIPKRRFYTHGKLASIRAALEAMAIGTDCFVWESNSDQMVRHAAAQLDIKIKSRKITIEDHNHKLKPTTTGYRIWRVT